METSRDLLWLIRHCDQTPKPLFAKLHHNGVVHLFSKELTMLRNTTRFSVQNKSNSKYYNLVKPELQEEAPLGQFKDFSSEKLNAEGGRTICRDTKAV